MDQGIVFVRRIVLGLDVLVEDLQVILK